jgi:hypothetical protein
MYPRPLSRREREVLDLLLAQDFPGRDAFATQAEAAEVIGGCGDCPCPSVELRVDTSRAGAAPHNPHVAGHLPLPARASGPAGDLILFHDKGWLAYLEYAAHDPDGLPLEELPEPAHLDVYTLPINN